ncbi:DUF6055 domain-containing protein [uncultured Draconibacterium sp.]|uniref:DUF6055 domain-containing protein n=1 Tax=uncultured Draconibacterium sp. TaxID=1573823 RepID=UPI002AA696E4|nr:DUF6055 domain-containing protein [uncultured Draconibacterium sp.]
MKSTSTFRIYALAFLLLSFYLADAKPPLLLNNISIVGKKKELYLPKEIDRVPKGNDFRDPESQFSYKHMLESENVAIFWDKIYGDDPMKNSDKEKRFDVKKLSSEVERFYHYYRDTLKMVEKGNSLTDKYKMIVIVFSDDKDRTAYGGGLEDKIGALWTPCQRINKMPFGTLAHELGHSFQYMSSIDAGTGPMGGIMEMSAQYMLWQVYSEWMTFENYHLVDFMKQTHYAFLHSANMYHSPYVLEYWSEKRGKDFFGKLSRSTQKGEDVVSTYKRITNLNQQQFNDEMFDASRHFITWDLKRVEKVAHQYANQHYTILNDAGKGWYRIDSTKCPQNYGYNGIKLNVPASGTKVHLEFEGIAGANGYGAVKLEKAGWRYGFVASLKDGNRVYGDINRSAKGKVNFVVPENTEYLWLVVSGAPTEHWPIVMRWGPPTDDDPKEEQWPYRIKLEGTTIDSSFIK